MYKNDEHTATQDTTEHYTHTALSVLLQKLANKNCLM